ncbi:uncharacterized protein [Palaemon carinicauda]|uniref:uncharacterized protein isoform X2 n=1 Tax=Palaemon carinicauda TaxID=392227 RepID=UPI0035B5D9C8
MILLLLCVLTAVPASASSHQQIQTSNEKETAIFEIPKNGSTYLAFWASDQNASFTFEIDGFNFTKDGEESSNHVTFHSFEPYKWHFMRNFMGIIKTYLGFSASDQDASFPFEINGFNFTKDGEENSTHVTIHSFEPNRWHLMRIFIGTFMNRTQIKRVLIFPNTVYNMTGDLKGPRNISIKSHGQIYWTQCNYNHSCNFSGSILNGTEKTTTSTMNLTTIVLITACGLLILAVVGMAVFIIRGKEFKPKEDAINEEVDLAENFGNFDREQEDHESVNSLYGAVIHRQE